MCPSNLIIIGSKGLGKSLLCSCRQTHMTGYQRSSMPEKSSASTSIPTSTICLSMVVALLRLTGSLKVTAEKQCCDSCGIKKASSTSSCCKPRNGLTNDFFNQKVDNLANKITHECPRHGTVQSFHSNALLHSATEPPQNLLTL